MGKSWIDWTDDELANDAQAGMRGQGAVVEATRRLRDSINAFRVSSDSYSKRMLVLTIVLIILTIVQAISVVPVIREWF